MINLFEKDAIAYLARVAAKLDSPPKNPNSNHHEAPLGSAVLRQAIALQLAYHRKLESDDAPRETRSLTINSTGFPDLASLRGDLARAYSEFDRIKVRRSDDMRPIIRSLDSGRLDEALALTGSVAKTLGGDHIILKALEKDGDNRKYVEAPVGHRNFYLMYDPVWEGLLFTKYTQGGDNHSKGQYESGYKYIDSPTDPLLIKVKIDSQDFMGLFKKALGQSEEYGRNRTARITALPADLRLAIFRHDFTQGGIPEYNKMVDDFNNFNQDITDLNNLYRNLLDGRNISATEFTSFSREYIENINRLISQMKDESTRIVLSAVFKDKISSITKLGHKRDRSEVSQQAGWRGRLGLRG